MEQNSNNSNAEQQRPLLRCMIVALTEEAGNEFASWLFGAESKKDGIFSSSYQDYDFKAYVRWPECPKGLPGAPASDALIIRVKNNDEWSKVYDYVREKGLIQFKLAVIDEDIQTLSEEAKPNIVVKFPEKSNSQILEELIKAEKELNDLLLSVFKNFDKSGDGFINLSEMETLCRELGVDVTHSDFHETLVSLDVNHDNKISFEEFSDWYKNGRQCSKLMENLILMRIATSSFLNSWTNSPYLQNLKEKVEYLKKEKRELINSFLSLNMEQVKQQPEVMLSFDGYFGGEFKETISKSYVQNYEEGLKSTDFFLIVEFQLKDPSKTDKIQKIMTNLINITRESFMNVSKKMFSFFNNDVSIKVLKKNADTLCLSLKIRRNAKLELLSIENAIQSVLDDDITQKVSFSFCLSGDVEKVKSNPTGIFVDSFNPAASLELKTEILKKNLKLIIKSFKSHLPKFLKFWLNSYGGSHINLKFNLEHLKSLDNSILQQQNQLIIAFLNTKLKEILQDVLSSFGGFNMFQKFYENVKNHFNVVLNTPQIHATAKIDISGVETLIN
jgi:hypothetical protein